MGQGEMVTWYQNCSKYWSNNVFTLTPLQGIISKAFETEFLGLLRSLELILRICISDTNELLNVFSFNKFMQLKKKAILILSQNHFQKEDIFLK